MQYGELEMKKSGFFSVLLGLVFAVSVNTPISMAAAKSKIVWHKNLKNAFKPAKQQGKPLMVEFMAEWCPSCKMTEDSTFVNPAEIKKADRFFPVRIVMDSVLAEAK